MKNLYLFVFILFTFYFSNAQNIVFQDNGFRDYLVSTNCFDSNNDGTPDTDADSNNDNEISYGELSSTNNLFLDGGSFTSIFELYYFNSLSKLKITDTQISQITIYNDNLLDVQIHGNLLLNKIIINDVYNMQNFDCSNNQIDQIVFYNANIINFNCSNNQIKSLKFFENNTISNLNCSNNQLVNLDLKKCPYIANLDCSNNAIQNIILFSNYTFVVSSINFSNNPSIQNICVGTQDFPLINTNIVSYGLTNVSVSNTCLATPCPPTAICFQDVRFEFRVFENVPAVDTNYNGFIEITEAQTVTSLSLNSNFNLIGIKQFSGLQYLNISNYQTTSLDISNLSNLKNLIIHSSPNLPNLNISGLTGLETIELTSNFNGLGSLDLSDSILLTSVICSRNSIVNLNISGLSNLVHLDLNSNGIRTLDLTGSPNLTYVNLRYNNINNLNINGLTNITQLNVSNNFLENLNVSNLLNLTHLDCANNKLTTLSIETLVNLRNLNCSTNYLTHMFLKNGNSAADFDTLNFYGNPNLDHICADTVDFPLIQGSTIGYNQAYIIVDSSCDVANPCGVGIVCINDTNFKNKLFSLGKDINSDHHIQKTEALAVTSLNISTATNTTALDILDLTGIEYFTNLQNFNCVGNNLEILNLTNNINLTTLDCSFNKLKNSTNFNITNLPILNSVFCNNNILTTINLSGLIGLKTIKCNNNSIDNLIFSGLNLLEDVDCNSNLITTLNLTGCNGLLKLDCSKNPTLTSCDFSTLTSLTNLNINNTSISNVNLNSNILLQRIEANQISGMSSLLISNLINLTDLKLNNNYTALGSLDLTTLTKLATLYCGLSNISSIDVSGLKKLITVEITALNIPELDLGASQGLSSLNINGATINYLNIKNNSTLTNFGSSNTNVQYMCKDDFDVFSNNFQPLSNSYCSFQPGGNYNTVSGTLRLDLDNNCSATDIPMNLVKIESNQTTGFNKTYTDSNGTYNFYPIGTSVTLTPKFPNNYFVSVPASITTTFNATTTSQIANFCIKPSNVIRKDLEISIYSVGDVRPGFTTAFYIIYKNNGNNTQSGTINFNFNDTLLSLSSSNPTVSSSIFNNLNWNFTSLKPFETRYIIVNLVANTPMDTPPLNAGEILNFTATIPLVNDQYQEDNTFTMKVGVINSFDPNDKTVIEGSQIEISRINNFLHYIVRFQNTGNADAVNVVIKDIIANNLDINTLEKVASSHSCRTLISNGNKVEFFFDTINLPPSSVNEIGSNGFVAFKIKPLSNSVIGDVFSNTANIYFDYNYPIITNTTETQVIALLGTQNFEFTENLKISPNPVIETLNVISKNDTELTNAQIYNELGQLIIDVSDSETIKNINVVNLKSGLYFIKVKTNKGESYSKFIKQ